MQQERTMRVTLLLGGRKRKVLRWTHDSDSPRFRLAPPRPAPPTNPAPPRCAVLRPAPSRPWGIRVLGSRARKETSRPFTHTAWKSRRNVGPWKHSPARPCPGPPNPARPRPAWPSPGPAQPSPRARPRMGVHSGFALESFYGPADQLSFFEHLLVPRTFWKNCMVLNLPHDVEAKMLWESGEKTRAGAAAGQAEYPASGGKEMSRGFSRGLLGGFQLPILRRTAACGKEWQTHPVMIRKPFGEDDGMHEISPDLRARSDEGSLRDSHI